MDIRKFAVKNRIDIMLVIVVFVVALLPRVVGLGVFLTADEKNWMNRSYEFVRAFKDFRFNDMLQTTHPGVTTMWLAGSGITAKMLVDDIPFSFRNIVHFVKSAQLPIALVNTLFVVGIYLLLKLLFSDKKRMRWLPFVGSLLIALNPFLIGYSRVAHVDALLAGSLFAASLAVMLYAQRGYSRMWLVVSAVLSAFALLTKAPAVFIIPFFVLVVLVHEGKQLISKEVLQLRIKDFILWFLLITLIILVVWPALLWVPNPEGNVLLLKRDIGRAAITPHNMTESYSMNILYYPATLLARSTPFTFVFSFIFLIFFIRMFLRKKAIDTNILLLLAYVFFFVVMMTLGAKKGDRYILPVFPALDVLAVAGVLYAARLWRRKYVFGLVSAIAVLYLGVVVYAYHPYAISYSNPLFPDNMSQELGWGEGLNQVGEWLSENASDALVASWYSQELAAYTSARVVDLNVHEHAQVRYVVLYRNMFGRADDHPATDFIREYYDQYEPVYVVSIAGKEFAWVYEKQAYERVVDELLPSMYVEQEMLVEQDNLVGVNVRVATYSGRAQSGSLTVEILDEGFVLYRWNVSVADIEDDTWLSLRLPYEQNLSGKSVVVRVYTTGTMKGDAPTVRYTNQYRYYSSNMVVSGESKEGNLAVQLRY